MSIETLESRVYSLCEELKNNGKKGPAEYFEMLLNRVKSPLSKKDKNEALQQIISSGKISDVANFSMKEDRLLSLVYEEANKLKGIS